MREFLELSPVGKTEGMILGKVKKHPDDPDAYALYAAHRMVAGDNNNLVSLRSSRTPKVNVLNVFLHISGSMVFM